MSLEPLAASRHPSVQFPHKVVSLLHPLVVAGVLANDLNKLTQQFVMIDFDEFELSLN